MIIAGTGHRPNKLYNEYGGIGPLSKWVTEELTKMLVDLKPEKIISGMALGFDTNLAITALNLKIPLVAAIPFVGQEKAWISSSQDVYFSILDHELTTKHIVCEGGYASWKMQKRNEWMVDNADLIIACYDGTSGGTRNCYNYALKKEKQIIRINPLDYGSTKTIFHHPV